MIYRSKKSYESIVSDVRIDVMAISRMNRHPELDIPLEVALNELDLDEREHLHLMSFAKTLYFRVNHELEKVLSSKKSVSYGIAYIANSKTAPGLFNLILGEVIGSFLEKKFLSYMLGDSDFGFTISQLEKQTIERLTCH